jgi:signal transduction histidine kinase
LVFIYFTFESFNVNDFGPLADFLRKNERQITDRYFKFVWDRRFYSNTVLLEGAWKMAIASVNKVAIEMAENGEITSGGQLSNEKAFDPLVEFGVKHAKMHRSYGIAPPMFLGLFNQSHRAFVECITESFEHPQKELYVQFIDRMFESIGMGLMSEWMSGNNDSHMMDLMQRNHLLINEKNRILTIFENLPEGIIILDVDGSPSFVNNTYSALFLPGKVSGETYYELEKKVPLPLWLTDHITEMLSGKEGQRVFEMELDTAKGLKKFDVQITTILNANEEFCGFIVLYNDITERQRMFNELKLADEKIRLLGDITRHDILNILTVLNGNVQLLEIKATDPALAKYLKAIGDSSKDIQRLLESAKSYQKLGSQQPLWLRLRDTASLGVSSAGLGDVKVHNEVDESIEIFSDPMLDRAFGNLAYNVQKHASSARNIWIRVEPSTKDSIDVVFEDDGPGIPMERKESIFTDKNRGQTKHGLHFVQRLLQLTGMSIRENGQPGKGARFVIHVPKREHRSISSPRMGEK